MKKVGIMTLHIGDNYGALLQCYALRHVVNQFDDIQADIINFDPGREFPVYEDREVQVGYEKKLEKFRRFNLVYSGVSDQPFTDIHAPEADGYDFYITGSDQVWNTSFSFANEAYFLNFVQNGAKKIAYAASIGIPPSSPRIKREWFERNIPLFDCLSLREETHLAFLQEFTDKEVYSVVDPTLLLAAQDYDAMCEGVTYPDGDYLVLYFLKHDNSEMAVMELANLVSRKYGLKVVYSFADIPGRVFKHESESFYDSDPREFVQMIKHAKAVVTNSFHGTVFSLLYHVPFFTYLVSSMSSRIVSLLEQVGLEERIVKGYYPVSDDMLDMNFERADSVLAEKRRESIEFLKMSLETGAR